MKIFTRAALAAAAIVLTAAAATTAMAEPATFRISTENNANHVNTKLLQSFATALQAKTVGKLKVELFHSGQLFKGRDVPKALRQGGVEMAVVGTWQLGGIEPDIGVFFVPSFYGLASSDVHKLSDGDIGKAINAGLAQKLKVTVIGRWADLGPAQLFTTSKAVKTHEDLAGLKLRIPGGAANSARLKALGAAPTVVPWPDTALALQQRTVDGLMTTFETAASAKLWEAGVAHAFENNQYFAQYVPMVSNVFWSAASPDVRSAITSTWEALVDEGRKAAAAAQTEARATLAKNGVTIVVPSAAELRTWRERMQKIEPELVKTLKIDPALHAKVVAALK